VIRLHLRENPADALDELLYHVLNPPRWGIDSIDAAVRVGISENFEGERSAAGMWAQLAPSTQVQRAALGYGPAHKILVRTGNYRADFVSPGGEHSVQFERTSEGWRVVVGSNDKRVPWLEGGTARIPPRPATLLEARAEERIGAALDAILRAV
jgi:hypothetical protein